MKKLVFISVVILGILLIVSLVLTQFVKKSFDNQVSDTFEFENTNSSNKNISNNDALVNPEIINNTQIEPMQSAFSQQAQLVDVANGTATGTAMAGFDNQYIVIAGFNNLPPLQEGFFYEGWIVRTSPQSVISTGKATQDGEMYTNQFTSDINYLDHTRYVLTLEPDDGDPAPAEHILEGTFEENSTY